MQSTPRGGQCGPAKPAVLAPRHPGRSAAASPSDGDKIQRARDNRRRSVRNWPGSPSHRPRCVRRCCPGSTQPNAGRRCGRNGSSRRAVPIATAPRHRPLRPGAAKPMTTSLASPAATDSGSSPRHLVGVAGQPGERQYRTQPSPPLQRHLSADRPCTKNTRRIAGHPTQSSALPRRPHAKTPGST